MGRRSVDKTITVRVFSRTAREIEAKYKRKDEFFADTMERLLKCKMRVV